MFENLKSVKGVGAATVKKLTDAGLDDAQKIVTAGIEGLKAAGLNKPIAVSVLEFATRLLPPTPAANEATPGVEAPGSSGTPKGKKEKKVKADKPKPVSDGLGDSSMADAFRRAAAKGDIDLGQLRSALPPADAAPAAAAKPVPAPEPKKADNRPKPLDIGIKKDEAMVLTDPAQLREVFDKLPNGQVPTSASFIRGIKVHCRMCVALVPEEPRSLLIDEAMVLLIHDRKKNSTRAAIFCKEHAHTAHGQATTNFRGNEDIVVELISLREAWTRLLTGYKSQIAARSEAQKADERKARKAALLQAGIEALDNESLWLTEKMLGDLGGPLDAPVYLFGASVEEAAEFGFQTTEAEITAFRPRWEQFEAGYFECLSRNNIPDTAEHLRMVQWLRDEAVREKRTPRLSLMVIRRRFDGHLRYLVVHESVANEVLKKHQERAKVECRITAWSYDFLTRRFNIHREEVQARAKKAFGQTREGKALASFLNEGPADATSATDANLMVSRRARDGKR